MPGLLIGLACASMEITQRQSAPDIAHRIAVNAMLLHQLMATRAPACAARWSLTGHSGSHESHRLPMPEVPGEA